MDIDKVLLHFKHILSVFFKYCVHHSNCLQAIKIYSTISFEEFKLNKQKLGQLLAELETRRLL